MLCSMVFGHKMLSFESSKIMAIILLKLWTGQFNLLKNIQGVTFNNKLVRMWLKFGAC